MKDRLIKLFVATLLVLEVNCTANRNGLISRADRLGYLDSLGYRTMLSALEKTDTSEIDIHERAVTWIKNHTSRSIILDTPDALQTEASTASALGYRVVRVKGSGETLYKVEEEYGGTYFEDKSSELLLHYMLTGDHILEDQLELRTPAHTAVFAGLGGETFGYSFILDEIISPHISVRTGFSWFFSPLTFPASVSYLSGGKNKVELGVGLRYSTDTTTSNYYPFKSHWIPFALAGYRYQSYIPNRFSTCL